MAARPHLCLGDTQEGRGQAMARPAARAGAWLAQGHVSSAALVILFRAAAEGRAGRGGCGALPAGAAADVMLLPPQRLHVSAARPGSGAAACAECAVTLGTRSHTHGHRHTLTHTRVVGSAGPLRPHCTPSPPRRGPRG